jgi:hypothetical protein
MRDKTRLSDKIRRRKIYIVLKFIYVHWGEGVTKVRARGEGEGEGEGARVARERARGWRRGLTRNEFESVNVNSCTAGLPFYHDVIERPSQDDPLISTRPSLIQESRQEKTSQDKARAKTITRKDNRQTRLDKIRQG